VLWNASVHPAREHPLGGVLASEREGVVITPVAVDVDVAAPQSLVPEAQLLHDAQAGLVLRTDADLHPMQSVLPERRIGRERYGRRRDALTREPLADPVAD